MRLKIFTDGGARGNPGPAGIGVYVCDDQGQEIFSHSAYLGEATNNMAEYQAFKASLEWLVEYLASHQVEQVNWYLDSMLVVEQLQRHWKIKEPHLQTLAQQIWRQLEQVSVPYTIAHVPRAQNAEADRLVNQALDAQ